VIAFRAWQRLQRVLGRRKMQIIQRRDAPVPNTTEMIRGTISSLAKGLLH
jgi:hypothetical protein